MKKLKLIKAKKLILNQNKKKKKFLKNQYQPMQI